MRGGSITALASLHRYQAQASTEPDSDCADVHWRFLSKHKQLRTFCRQKWSYLNVERGTHSGNFVFTLPEAR